MAPTNKAARIINGETLHKFQSSLILNDLKKSKYIYLLMRSQWFKRSGINSLYT